MKNRNPYLAFILSFLFSGLGQVYNGELKRGIIFLVLVFPIYILICLTGLIQSFTGLAIVTSILLVYKLLVAFEAYSKSKSLNPYQIKPINRTTKYLLFVVFGFAINCIGVEIGRTIIGYETFEIPTPSMEPTMMVGDKIMATRIKPSEIKHGDIVTFTKDDGQKYLSRVIGLPGDNIEIIEDIASVNGEMEIWIEEGNQIKDQFEFKEYLCEHPNKKKYGVLKMIKFNGREIPTQEISNKNMVTVKDDNIYVLGDNRNNSMDSRMYGTIPIKNVEKKVQYIWWNKNKSRIGNFLNE